MRRLPVLFTMLMVFIPAGTMGAEEAFSREVAVKALNKAVAFFSGEVSVQGGYLWKYNDDLSYREGEGKAYEKTAWVQPPGTPSVGEAYLDAYEMSGMASCLDAARQTAHALVYGQLASGGWDYRIEFDSTRGGKYAYRHRADGDAGRNSTTLDDDTTQSALRFLTRCDKVLEFKDAAVHEAVTFGLEALLQAQYPNGAWPQRYEKFPNPEAFPVKRASYPKEWSRTFPSKDYKNYYTFNDNAIADVIDTMILATRAYGDPRYQAAAERAGNFMLLAQMPPPQPAWAQQYNHDMEPDWARKFEPPSVTGGESQGVMRTLIRLYHETGKKRFLQPIPRALAYLKSSQREDGRLARFYELKTNKPLYFTLDYELTYDDSDMPTHYAFIVSNGLEGIASEYNAALKSGPKPRKVSPAKAGRLTDDLAKRAARVVEAMDDRGAWVGDGKMKNYSEEEAGTRVIDCRTFAENLRVLASYIGASTR